MKAFVVDSSVAAKWLPPLNNEPLASEARGLLADWTYGKIELKILISYGLPVTASATILEMALRIGIEYERTVYDSIYVALAVQSGRELVTADEKLANALAAYFPVKWIGAM